jgi:hypothetical protein
MDEFKKQYLNLWRPSREYEEAYKLWLWYHYNCELYDSKICTGRNEYEAYIPANLDEHRLIILNCSRNMKTINTKRLLLKNENIIISEEDWIKARRSFIRFKLKALEQEYKTYFGDE